MMSDQKQAFTVKEFAQMFSISTDTVKRLAKIGALATIKIGDRRLVPADEVERVVRHGLPGAKGSKAQPKVIDGKTLAAGGE